MFEFRGLFRAFAWVVASAVLGHGALAQAPLVTPGQFLDGDTALGGAGSDQRDAAVAAGGGRFLAVWSDRRGELQAGDEAMESNADIWMQLLDAQGVAVWDTPRRLAASPEVEFAPKLAWNGSAWLVAWSERSIWNGSMPLGDRVRAVRVDVNGAVLDPQPVLLFSTLHSVLAVASDGQGWAVAIDGDQGGHGAGRAVSATFGLGPATALFSAATIFKSLVFAQNTYIAVGVPLVVALPSEVFARRFDSALAALDASEYSLFTDTVSVRGLVVGSNGAELLLAYGVPAPVSPQYSLRCARVSTSGALFATGDLSTLVIAQDPIDSIAWDGANWFVALGGLRLARVSATGLVLDFGGFSIGATQSPVQLAGGSGGVLAVWPAPTPTQLVSAAARQVTASRYVTSPTQLGPTLLPGRSARAQFAPCLAASDSGAAVLFISHDNAGARVNFARVDEYGAPLDAAPVIVGSAPDARTPVLAWDGQRYLAAWVESTSTNPFVALRVRRISAAGALLDATPKSLSGIFSVPLDLAIAGRNGEFVIAGVRQNVVFRARVRGSDAAVLNAPTTLATVNAQRISICATANGYLLAWSYLNPFNWGAVAGQVLDALGAPGAQFELSPPAASDSFGAIDLATSGAELLCVWQKGSAFFADRHLLARRVDSSGVPLDAAPFPLFAAGGAEEFSPDLAWDGSNYLCAFQRSTASARSDVAATRISSAGAVLDPAGIALESGAESEGQPTTLGRGAGRTLVASSVFRPDAPWAAYRVSTRALIDGCPAPSTYCTAKPNSQQCLAAISASGAPSASGTGSCIVSAANILNGTQGLLLYGYQSSITPFQGGFMCIAAPRRRTPLQLATSSGGGGPCDGQFAFDLNALVASGSDPFLSSAGQRFACQYWSRDGGVAFGSVLSNALEGVVCW